MVALVFSCMLAYAQTNGEVIVMNKAMFIRLVRTLPHGGSHYEGTGQRVCR